MGFQSCAEWLHWRCDIGLSAAREKVRVAHALTTYPRSTSAAARTGSATPDHYDITVRVEEKSLGLVPSRQIRIRTIVA
jgi:hypothetical protein